MAQNINICTSIPRILMQQIMIRMRARMLQTHAAPIIIAM